MSIVFLMGMLVPFFLGAALLTLVVVVIRGTILVHFGRPVDNGRLDVQQLRDRIQQINQDLQKIKEQIADLTIQLDDPRFRLR